jgi:hypothetical protein
LTGRGFTIQRVLKYALSLQETGDLLRISKEEIEKISENVIISEEIKNKFIESVKDRDSIDISDDLLNTCHNILELDMDTQNSLIKNINKLI